MKKKSANLAVVSNNSFEASKVVNLHHFDISSALQTSLEFDELISIFSNKIQKIIPHNGFIYKNDEFNLEIKQGVVTKHSCAYALKVEALQLGNLKIMRRTRFEESEIKLLESLLCALIYPLKNATLYNQALRMAYTDPLTKTYNRAAFNDTLNREISLSHRHSHHLSVIFLDIDHFKTINDQFGHECGDIALTSIANSIKEQIRSTDTIFRYGGEEFVILLSETDSKTAEIIAQRIHKRIENHCIAYGMNVIKLTASLGISCLRGNDSNESFIKRADEAMYRAKQNGRNQIQLESPVQLV